MFGLDFQAQSLWVNLFVYAIGAIVIWIAGSRVAEYADAISDKTNLGSAFVGLVLLSLATGTPELGTTAAAASAGHASLAVNNIFGGIAMQTAVLAVADLVVAGAALTALVPDPVLLMEGVLLTGLLGLILVAMTTTDVMPSFWGVGVWTPILLGAQILALYFSYRYQGRRRWVADHEMEDEDLQERARRAAYRSEETYETKVKEIQEQRARYRKWSLARLILSFGIGTGVILAAGVALARAGDALATQTGLGQSFVGATFLAIGTSLPEVSTTITSVRLGNNAMAISNIFGSNANMVLQLFIADLFYREGPILNAVGAPAMVSAAIGIVLTVIYLVGLLERQDKTLFGIGIDSAVVVVLYPASLVLLYLLRGSA